MMTMPSNIPESGPTSTHELTTPTLTKPVNTEPTLSTHEEKSITAPASATPAPAQVATHVKTPIAAFAIPVTPAPAPKAPRERIDIMTLTGDTKLEEKIDSNSVTFASEFATIAVKYKSGARLPTHKAIYFEARVVTGQLAQLGWANLRRFKPNDTEGIGAGDGEYSWSYDGSRKGKYHRGEEGDYGTLWYAGDVVGCKFDSARGLITYSLNGQDMGVAFELKFNQQLVPVVTCHENETVEIVTHREDLKYLPEDSIPLYEIITKNVDLSDPEGESNDEKKQSEAPYEISPMTLIANKDDSIIKQSRISFKTWDPGQKINITKMTGDMILEQKKASLISARFVSEFGTIALKYPHERDFPGKMNIYYETCVVTGQLAQVGWADTDNFEPSCHDGIGAGDDRYSWSYDGSRRQTYHDGWERDYGILWKAGDTVGCTFQPGKGEISYSVNGKDMGLAFRITPNQKLCPVMTCAENEQLLILTHSEDMKYLPENCCPLYDVLTGEVGDLGPGEPRDFVNDVTMEDVITSRRISPNEMQSAEARKRLAPILHDKEDTFKKDLVSDEGEEHEDDEDEEDFEDDEEEDE